LQSQPFKCQPYDNGKKKQTKKKTNKKQANSDGLDNFPTCLPDDEVISEYSSGTRWGEEKDALRVHHFPPHVKLH